MMKELATILLFASFLTVLAAKDKTADIITALDVTNALKIQSSAGTFSTETKISNDHIGNWDTGKKEPVYPVRGSNCLVMNGGKASTVEARSSRIASSFIFTVSGAGSLTFYHRVATYVNDDLLVFYEDGIEEPLLELGGEYWSKKESWDGDVYFDLYAEDFWIEETLDLPVDRYSHTVKVALLCPYKGDSYWDAESDEIVQNCAYLDYFLWTPDDGMVICGFDTLDNATTFGGAGLEVSLYSTYESEGELVLEYWYTTDGSTPARNGKTSQKYDDAVGIVLPGSLPLGDVTVKVAAYDGTTLIGTYSQTYTRIISVGVPSVAIATQDGFTPGITFTLDCEAKSETLTYYYTMDGTEPTTASAQAKGNTILVENPCTLKVIASDGTEQSEEALVLTITQTSAPTLSVTADGKYVGDTLFSEYCIITVQGSNGAGVNYRQNEGDTVAYVSPLRLEESATLHFTTAGTADAANGVYQLNNSTPVSVSVVKEAPSDGTWATEQVAAFVPDKWNLFAVTKRLSKLQAEKLADWLQPYAYNATTHTLEQATALESGAAYLVRVERMDDNARPSTFADAGDAEPLSGKGNSWVLSSGQAEFTWDAEKALWLPAAPTTSEPGWRK